MSIKKSCIIKENYKFLDKCKYNINLMTKFFKKSIYHLNINLKCYNFIFLLFI